MLGPADAVRAASLKRAPRVHDPELDALRRALDFGRVEEAERLLPVAPRAGEEGLLLRARALALRKNTTFESLRVLEQVRTANPSNPDVYSTAAEIYAARDGADTAWQEIRRGEAACGSAPEFLRARGVLWILRENGAEKGLAFLEQAVEQDADLPFVDRSLGQAHLLVAKRRAQEKKVDEALVHVRASLAHDPEELDARRLEIELVAAAGDYELSITKLRALTTEHPELGSELALMEKRAGMALLLLGKRAGALEHFVAARAGGLTDAELGSAARLLAEAAHEREAAGVTAFEGGDLALAEIEFRAAVRFDPDSIASQNHLGVVLYKKKDFAGAAVQWRAVLASARREQIELPEPVHLSLAKAVLGGGDRVGARAVLAEYLALEPEGRWARVTRLAIDELP